jgi:2-methylcitrate dehydratase PrpD
MSMTIGEQLARHFASLDYDGIPAKHTADARQLVLDYLGVAIAGSQTESGQIAREFATKTGGVPEATLIPSGSASRRSMPRSPTRSRRTASSSTTWI